jgi:hypothetical protein
MFVTTYSFLKPIDYLAPSSLLILLGSWILMLELAMTTSLD